MKIQSLLQIISNSSLIASASWFPIAGTASPHVPASGCKLGAPHQQQSPTISTPSTAAKLLYAVRNAAERLDRETSELEGSLRETEGVPANAFEDTSKLGTQLNRWMKQLAACIAAGGDNPTLMADSREALAKSKLVLDRWITLARSLSEPRKQ
jgi:hypothetical protein